MTSYLRETEAENLQNGDVHLAQIPDFGMRYLENLALLFEFDLFFNWNFSLNFPKLSWK